MLIGIHGYANMDFIILLGCLVFFCQKRDKHKLKNGKYVVTLPQIFLVALTFLGANAIPLSDVSDVTMPSLEETLYDFLSVAENSSHLDIRSAYKKLTLKWHPDKADDKAEAAKQFSRIRHAYEVLSSSQRRKIYDFYKGDYIDMIDYFESNSFHRKMGELYEYTRHITILFERNLEKHLLSNENVWIVNFYHPNCGSCRKKVSFIKALAFRVHQSQKKIKVGTINCSVNPRLCYDFDLNHMGEFLFFPPNQMSAGMWDFKHYGGREEIGSMIDAAAELGNDKTLYLANERAIFETLLRGSHASALTKAPVEAVLLVDYFLPTCRQCIHLKSELRTLSSKISAPLQLAVIDCSKQRCNVPYFPYMQLYFKRKGTSIVEKVHLDYQYEGHPGALSIKLTNLLLNDVLGLSVAPVDGLDTLNSLYDEF